MHCMIFQMFSDSPQKNLKNNFLPDGLIIIYSCMNCVSFPVPIYLLVFIFYKYCQGRLLFVDKIVLLRFTRDKGASYRSKLIL